MKIPACAPKPGTPSAFTLIEHTTDAQTPPTLDLAVLHQPLKHVRRFSYSHPPLYPLFVYGDRGNKPQLVQMSPVLKKDRAFESLSVQLGSP